jgi:hypothetical protein
MSNAEMLDWINEHLVAFRNTMRDEGECPMELEWIDTNGDSHITRGENIRHCINNAVKEQHA